MSRIGDKTHGVFPDTDSGLDDYESEVEDDGEDVYSVERLYFVSVMMLVMMLMMVVVMMSVFHGTVVFFDDTKVPCKTCNSVAKIISALWPSIPGRGL